MHTWLVVKRALKELVEYFLLGTAWEAWYKNITECKCYSAN